MKQFSQEANRVVNANWFKPKVWGLVTGSGVNVCMSASDRYFLSYPDSRKSNIDLHPCMSLYFCCSYSLKSLPELKALSLLPDARKNMLPHWPAVLSFYMTGLYPFFRSLRTCAGTQQSGRSYSTAQHSTAVASEVVKALFGALTQNGLVAQLFECYALEILPGEAILSQICIRVTIAVWFQAAYE